MHLIYLPSSLTTSEGNSIDAAGSPYNVYVLSVAKTGYSNKLTAPTSITIAINNQGYKVEAPKPTATDTANNGTGADLRVTFSKPKSEVNIQEYRIIASTTTLDLTVANNVPAAGYKAVTPTNPRANYVVTLGEDQKIQDGTTAIQNDTAYKIYILAIGKNRYENVLSSPSNSITLSTYMPGAAVVRGLRVAKAGSGHDSSNINVIFYEPTLNVNVQKYKIFISPAASTLDEATVKGAASSLYQAVSPTKSNSLHSVSLTTGLTDYTGAALTTGAYKVYVLTVGKSGSASRLSAASGSVELD